MCRLLTLKALIVGRREWMLDVGRSDERESGLGLPISILKGKLRCSQDKGQEQPVNCAAPTPLHYLNLGGQRRQNLRVGFHGGQGKSYGACCIAPVTATFGGLRRYSVFEAFSRNHLLFFNDIDKHNNETEVTTIYCRSPTSLHNVTRIQTHALGHVPLCRHHRGPCPSPARSRAECK